MSKSHYCVIGLGRFGGEVANQLKQNNKNVMVLDSNPDLIQKAGKIYDIAMVCDCSDINSLSETGITNVKTVIVGISSIESSLMVCANLRQLGIKDVIAKASNNVHKRVLKTMGISRVVVPEVEMAQKIAVQAIYNIGMDVVSLGSGFSWIKLVVSNKEITTKTLSDLNLREKYDLTIILIQRQNQTITPTKDTKFMIGDVITIMCKEEKIKIVTKLFTINNN